MTITKVGPLLHIRYLLVMTPKVVGGFFFRVQGGGGGVVRRDRGGSPSNF